MSLLLIRALALLLPPDSRDEVLGDIEENHRIRLAVRGRLSADAWLWRQVLTAPFWLLVERITGGPSLTNTDGGRTSKHDGDPFMRSRSKDARMAFRSFIRSPGFTLVAVSTLALGIAANAAIFSVVDGILLESLPFPDADRIVSVTHRAPGIGLPEIGSATGLHRVYSEHSAALEDQGVYRGGVVNVTGKGEPERIPVLTATRSVFTTLGVEPVLGRPFAEEEDLPDGPRVTLLGHGLWTTRFGADPSVLGRTMIINGIPHEIVGVLPEGLRISGGPVRLATPMRIDPNAESFGGFNVVGIARLAPTATKADAEAELTGVFARVAETFTDINMELFENAQLGVTVQPLKEVLVGPVEAALWILMGTVGFVLLIACANVANLFLARAEGRQKEVAVRTAMGAGWKDLFWQYATESAVLAVSAGVLGAGLAFAGLELLLANAPANLPRLEQIRMDGSVLVFTAAISLVSAFLFGALPMLRHGLSAPGAVLRDGSRGATVGRRRNRGRQVLVATQIAFALVLLVGSGLMLRSFQQLLDVDLGFQAQDVTTFRVALPNQAYPDADAYARLHHDLIDRIAVLPGVEDVGAVSSIPLSEDYAGDPLNQEEKPLGPNQIPPVIPLKAASPGYFATLGIELLSGRMLERADAIDATGAVLVDRTTAERFWPGEDPLGKRVSQGLPGTVEWSTVVGVVADTPLNGLTQEPQGVVYYTIRPRDESGVQWIANAMTYVVRSRVPTDALLTRIRAEVRAIDPNLPVADVRMLEDHVADARVQMAFTMLLLSIAAGMGLLLGAVGIYGVISYLTSRRTREIGVRMALGAEASAVRRMVLRQGARVSLLGLALGVLGALGLTRFLDALLFEVSPTDPATFAVVAALLLAVSLLATYLPARRAAATAPQEALRSD